MIDPTKIEKEAIASCCKPLAETIAMHGADLSTYSKPQVLTLIEVVITAYQKYMIEHATEEQSHD